MKNPVVVTPVEHRKPGMFDRQLANMKQEIEFLMEFGIDKDKTVPKGLIDSLADLHKGLEGYLK